MRIKISLLVKAVLEKCNGTDMANAPNQDTFNAISLVNIGVLFKNDLPYTIDWCRRHGLLATEMVCATCDRACNEQNSAQKIDGKVWRCPVKRCKKAISIRKGSFFEISHLSLWKILGLTYLWCSNAGSGRGPSVDFVMKELDIGSCKTVVDWNQFCRDICVSFFLNNPQQIGGPGHVVEIDESLFSRRKYNRGRIVPEQWIFGGYDPQTKHGFLVPVPQRDAATLLPIIQQWVLPGSRIWSDMWAAYNNINALGYDHETVNHSLFFVDPVTDVHTNHVEAMWQRAKAKFKSMMGPTSRGCIPDYLSEFMWAQRFPEDRYFHFWQQVSVMYNV